MPSSMRRNRTRLPTCASTGLGFLPAISFLAINIEFENSKLTHILDETAILVVLKRCGLPPSSTQEPHPVFVRDALLRPMRPLHAQASHAAKANTMVEISRTNPN